MANSVDPDQTAPVGAVGSGSTLFASLLNSSVMPGNYLQQTTFSNVIVDSRFVFCFIFLLQIFQENHQSVSISLDSGQV